MSVSLGGTVHACLPRNAPAHRSGFPRAGIDGLAEAARDCRGCELYENATWTVFGAGAPAARVVLVGEQPGDQEDRQGAPFVGPAGKLLDRALEDAGIDRSETYVTNAVKHFRFTQAGPGKRASIRHQTWPTWSHASRGSTQNSWCSIRRW